MPRTMPAKRAASMHRFRISEINLWRNGHAISIASPAFAPAFRAFARSRHHGTRMTAFCRLALRPTFGILTLLSAFLVAAAAPAPAAEFDAAVERYRAVLIEDIGKSLAGARSLQERAGAGDIVGAKQAWLAARAGWERSEVFTGGFVPALDNDIDAWPDAAKGFHAIEARLFGVGHTDVADETKTLVLNLEELSTGLRTIPLSAQGLLNGIVRLAYEVGDSKVDGGESRISGTSLDDMRNNVDGIDTAYRMIFAPVVAARDPQRDAAVQRRIAALRAMVGAPGLRSIDADKLRTLSEELVVTLQNTAPMLGLGRPTLEEGGN
jgi:iron uptake system EfeUOB component EfeO/EfeM